MCMNLYKKFQVASASRLCNQITGQDDINHWNIQQRKKDKLKKVKLFKLIAFNLSKKIRRISQANF